MGVAVDPRAHPRHPVEQVDHVERRACQRVIGDLGDRDRGGECLPPSVETAATGRLGTFLLSAFSVPNASTVPVLDTVICPVSRKPCAELLATALTCTAADQVRPSSSECATYSLTCHCRRRCCRTPPSSHRPGRNEGWPASCRPRPSRDRRSSTCCRCSSRTPDWPTCGRRRRCGTR